ncbi:ClpX C4-type zinc finger protein [Serratia liquefaciens]|uniref:ClpX C4-type zinc finger protein n=1 Tax=Serratia liquefaciens TaxID=614 RepID=UPI0009DB9392
MKKGNPVMRCHFCTKTRDQVKKLIAGEFACICNECIVVCVDIIANGDESKGDNHG